MKITVLRKRKLVADDHTNTKFNRNCTTVSILFCWSTLNKNMEIGIQRQMQWMKWNYPNRNRKMYQLVLYYHDREREKKIIRTLITYTTNHGNMVIACKKEDDFIQWHRQILLIKKEFAFCGIIYRLLKFANIQTFKTLCRFENLSSWESMIDLFSFSS